VIANGPALDNDKKDTFSAKGTRYGLKNDAIQSINPEWENIKPQQFSNDIKKKLQSSQSNKQHLFDEIQELKKQYNKLKKNYDEDYSNYTKIQILVQKQQLVKTVDVKMQEEISRQLHELNDAVISLATAEKMQYSKALSYHNAKSSSSLEQMTKDYRLNGICHKTFHGYTELQMLQKMVEEKESLHTNRCNSIEIFRPHILQQLRILKQNIITLQERDEMSQEKEEMEEIMRELDKKLRSNESKLNESREKNYKVVNEVKEKEKDLRKLKMKADQQKHQLSSHQQAMDRMQLDLEAKLIAQESQKINLQAKVESLELILQKKESTTKEMEAREVEMEQEKDEYIHYKTKEVEKELRKEQKNT